MKQSINYITTLPDFIEMQRVSFCWFISQGLSEEWVEDEDDLALPTTNVQ